MSRLSRRAGRLGGGAGVVGPPDMDHEADQHQSDHEEPVQQQVRYHDNLPSHGGERRSLDRMHPLSNYPLAAGTGHPQLLKAILWQGAKCALSYRSVAAGLAHVLTYRVSRLISTA